MINKLLALVAGLFLAGCERENLKKPVPLFSCGDVVVFKADEQKAGVVIDRHLWRGDYSYSYTVKFSSPSSSLFSANRVFEESRCYEYELAKRFSPSFP